MLETIKYILFSAIAIVPMISSSTTTYTYIAKDTQNNIASTLEIIEIPKKSENISLLDRKISEKIFIYSKEYNVDVLLALNVACAESCTQTEEGIFFNPRAKNPNSTASGIFQFVKATWDSMCEGDVFDEDDNIRCAIKILSMKNGIRHWEASRNDGFGGGWENKPYEKFNVLN